MNNTIIIILNCLETKFILLKIDDNSKHIIIKLHKTIKIINDLKV